MNRKWGVMAWDVAGKPICYMCAEAIGYLTLVSAVRLAPFTCADRCLCVRMGVASRRCAMSCGNDVLYYTRLGFISCST